MYFSLEGDIMWSTFVWSFTCLLIFKDLFLTRHTFFVNTQTASLIPISDSEFEQVIAERYLFAPFANECSAWTVLSNVSYVWQAASLPRYHSQAAVGVWLLFQSITETFNTRARTLHMSWMSLSANGAMIILSEIDVKSNSSLLVTSHNEETALKYTAALISP
ncbi:unnamed protein product, partial [Adineta steineri]